MSCSCGNCTDLLIIPTGATGPAGGTGGTGPAGDAGVSVVGASVDGSGDLILTLSDATTINAGSVIGPAGTGISKYTETYVITEDLNKVVHSSAITTAGVSMGTGFSEIILDVFFQNKSGQWLKLASDQYTAVVDQISGDITLTMNTSGTFKVNIVG